MSWLLLPLALLLVWREWSLGRGRQGIIRRHARSRVLYDFLSLAALALLLLPAATTERSRIKPRLSIAVVIDVSPSMELSSGGPSRLDLARQEITALIDGLPEARLALIPFAGSAVLQVPLTGDHRALRFFLQTMHTGQISAPGSAPEEALAMAREVLSEIPDEKAILLFSDGERTLPTPAPSFDHDIPVYAVLPGDRLPHPVPGRTLAGAAATSTPDPARLRRLAEENGGHLLEQGTGDLAVAALLRQWEQNVLEDPTRPSEQALLLALLLLILRQFSWLGRRRLALSLLFFAALTGCRQDAPDKAGRQLFEQGLQQQDATTAAQTFSRAAEQLSGDEQAAALHNACSKLLTTRNYRAAVTGCEQALVASPGATDSAANLSLALRNLDQQPAGAGQGGEQQDQPGTDRVLSIAEAREIVRQAKIQPFANQELAPETLRVREIQVEKDW